jgi:hypothetical protein
MRGMGRPARLAAHESAMTAAMMPAINMAGAKMIQGGIGGGGTRCLRCSGGPELSISIKNPSGLGGGVFRAG